jgi:hypothetical protein
VCNEPGGGVLAGLELPVNADRPAEAPTRVDHD